MKYHRWIEKLTDRNSFTHFQPQTNAERKKKYLDKLKANGDFDTYKQKRAADAKDRRDRIKNGLEQLPKAVREKTKRLNRAYSRKKQAEYRRRKNGSLAQPTAASPNVVPSKSGDGYKTASALSKALSKVKRALPATSTKKKELVSKLLHSFNADEQAEIIQGKLTEPKSQKGIPLGVIEMAKAFYERDDVSRMSPNVKDCRTFVNESTGLKEVKQIRYLQHKLDDVYNMFISHIQSGQL